MSRGRVVRLGGAGVAVVLVLFGLWAAWQAWHVNRDLNDAVDRAEAVRAAVEDRDTDRLQRELDALREAADRAASRTSGPTWSVLTKLPILGDDADGVRVTSQVLDALADDGIEPLLTVSDQVDELLPSGGAVDLAAFRELNGPVTTAAAAFADADERLSAEDTSGYVGKLDEQFTRFRDEVHSAASALHSAQVATDLLPDLLGADRPRTYLLAFQNNAEVRGTGGLPGAVAYLRASHGKVRITRQLPGGSFGEADRPVLPLTEGEKGLYGDVLGTYFVDANMTPDVPRVADLMRAHSRARFPETRLDGVLLVDTVTMAYLLEATGPIDVAGVRITGDNVVDELLHHTYLRLEPAEQDVFFAAVAATAFNRFTSGGGSPPTMIEALARATEERRIAVHLFDDAAQERLAGSEIAGEAGTHGDDRTPRVAVTVNDTTGAKMSYFLRWDVDVAATSCSSGRQAFRASATVLSQAPANAAKLPDYVTGGGQFGIEPGSQIVTVRVFGPRNGDLDGFMIDGEDADLSVTDVDGRPVGMTFLQLDPGQQVELGWTMRAGSGQRDDAIVTTTPSIEQKASVLTVPTAC